MSSTVIRVPATTGLPIITAGSETIVGASMLGLLAQYRAGEPAGQSASPGLGTVGPVTTRTTCCVRLPVEGEPLSLEVPKGADAPDFQEGFRRATFGLTTN